MLIMGFWFMFISMNITFLAGLSNWSRKRGEEEIGQYEGLELEWEVEGNRKIRGR